MVAEDDRLAEPPKRVRKAEDVDPVKDVREREVLCAEFVTNQPSSWRV